MATAELTGELTTAFSGVTIAIPALLALTALAVCRELATWRATAIALLTGFAYLTATYLAQGSFKELFETVFLVALALWLRELSQKGTAEPRSWRTGAVAGVIGAGALYAYSGPGLAWLIGTVIAWGILELVRRRDEPAAEVVGRALPALGAGVLVALALAAPELDRIADFGGSVGTVSDRAEAFPGANGRDLQPMARVSADRGGSDTTPTDRRSEEPEFDDDLGNLFGQISPLEVFGVWPSGDFRVAPGDGAVPAIIFYLGALLGATGLAVGIAWALGRGETALLAALAAAAAIWVAARIGSTPYTTAKALAMIAPVAMLISARGLLDPTLTIRGRPPADVARALLASAFVAAAALSSGLALANAPVGPLEYTPGVFALSDRFADRSVLLLVEDEVLADQRGEEFYGWELRDAGSFEIRPASDPGSTGGFDLVVTVEDGRVEATGIR